MPFDTVAPSAIAKRDACEFLDSLKAAGVVITNEEILRNHIVDDVERQTDLSEFFLFWVTRGRPFGVTFYISGAGVDMQKLKKAFAYVQLTSNASRTFLDNLRPEPYREVLANFTGRGES